MNQNARPLSEVVPAVRALELDVPVPADDILLRMNTIDRVATIARFESGVRFRLSDSPDQLITQSFNASYPTDDQPASVTEFLNDYLIHDCPSLTVDLNISGMQRYLQTRGANIQDPRPWAKLMDAHLSVELYSAAKRHLCRDAFVTKAEAIMAIIATTLGEAGTFYNDTFLTFLDTTSIGDYLKVPLTVAVWLNVAKMAIRHAGKRPFHDACFSLIPGYHYDLLGIVYGVTACRHLVRAV